MNTPHTPIENEEADPVGPADPLATITEVAMRHGMLQPGEKLGSNLLDFAAELIDRAATVGEGYGDAEAGGNAGEHIRAALYPY